MAQIGIVIGSTRPKRFGVQPAAWLKTLGSEHAEHTYELVDIAEAELPMLDEPLPAVSQQYQHDHTNAWAKTIAAYDGFIFVMAEYNHTIVPSLMNAINFLYHEWRNKPVALVSYGAEMGGGRAVEHMRAIAGQLGMFDIHPTLSIVNYYHHLDASGHWQPNEQQIKQGHKILADIGFWADELKRSRDKLAAQ